MSDITNGEIRNGEMRDRLGNIDQIRELLFGRQLKEYEQQFSTLEQRLEKVESSLSTFQGEVREQLRQFQDALTTEIRSTLDALDKKLQYLRLTQHETTGKLQQELQVLEQKSSHGIVSLHETVASQAKLFQADLSKVKDHLESDIQILRNQVFEELEKQVSALETSKISRSALAEVFFDLCLKIKDAGLITPSSTGSDGGIDNPIRAELLLPEQH